MPHAVASRTRRSPWVTSTRNDSAVRPPRRRVTASSNGSSNRPTLRKWQEKLAGRVNDDSNPAARRAKAAT